MKKSILTAATLLIAAGCGEGEQDHGHDHDNEAAHAEGHDEAGHDGEAGHDEHGHADHDNVASDGAPEVGGAVSFKLGGNDGTLSASAETLTLTLEGADGAAIAPEGVVKVVLTGTDEDSQRVVLKPADGGWSGAAKAAGAKGYVAVIDWTVGGRVETARATWGEVPEAKAAPKKEAADDHEDDEGHGHGGHDHGH